MYINARKICYVYILNIFNLNYMNINIYSTLKYFQYIYCMCIYVFMHNKYTQYTYYIIKTKTFILDVINRD